MPRFVSVIFLGVAIGVTACSSPNRISAVPDPMPPVAPVVQSQEAPSGPVEQAVAKPSVSHCTVATELPARGSCFQHTEGRRGQLCQPQSIPYARCRSQISSCNLGNTSPVELFNCEQKRGYTLPIPVAGALMSIGVNHLHHMSTGHTLYVEEVCPNADGTYRLRVSHTNYDRRCHLEEDVWVHYDPRQKTADFTTGHWSAWGKHLPVQGFILHEPAEGLDARPGKPD